jgi:hypothetical protein
MRILKTADNDMIVYDTIKTDSSNNIKFYEFMQNFREELKIPEGFDE